MVNAHRLRRRDPAVLIMKASMGPNGAIVEMPFKTCTLDISYLHVSSLVVSHPLALDHPVLVMQLFDQGLSVLSLLQRRLRLLRWVVLHDGFVLVIQNLGATHIHTVAAQAKVG